MKGSEGGAPLGRTQQRPGGRRTASNESHPTVDVIGRRDLLDVPSLGLFSSRRIPPDLIIPSFQLSVKLRRWRIAVAGGFQSSLENHCLTLLLRGGQPVLVFPARSLVRMKIPARWRQPLRDGRLAVASSLPSMCRRPTSRSSELRNRLVATVANRLLIVHAEPGTRTFALATSCLDDGKPVCCFDHPGNRELLLLGAVGIDQASPELGDVHPDAPPTATPARLGGRS